MSVFVLDKHKVPMGTCSEKRARKLLDKGRAVVHRVIPFTIRVKDRLAKESVIPVQTLRIDDGSKVTGIAITAEQKRIVFLAELHHKQGVSESLSNRRSVRRSRRNRKTRYRRCKFPNKRGQKTTFTSARRENWLAPSLQARVIQIENTIKKLKRWTPIHSIWIESARFDTQKMQNPEMSGVEYQQGTLQGYEVRQYLLEKFGRCCAYCESTGVALQVEHVHPKSRGGSDRVDNLTLSCEECNQEKNNSTLEEWSESLKKKRTSRPK